MSRAIFTAALLAVFGTALTAHAQPPDMELRGQGVVYWMRFIKVYDAYLYTVDESDRSKILDPGVSKCLRLEYSVSLSPEDFIKGADTVLARQHPPEYLASIQSEIDALHDAYAPVEKGDSYLMCYRADEATTTLALNGAELVSIQSEPFSAAYFGIWLGPEEPLSEDLRDDLLGESG